MSFLKKLLGVSAALLLCIGMFFYENIGGYFRFKKICAADSGLRIYAPVLPGVGWRVAGGSVAQALFPLSIRGVGFVRYRNEKDGALYDVFSMPKTNVGDDGYVQKRADLQNPAIYEYRYNRKMLAGEIRMFQVLEEVVDLRTKATAATYTTFGYSQFEPSRTLLAAPSVAMCPDDVLKIDKTTGKRLPSKVEVALSSIFKN